VDGVSDCRKITELFADKYEKLYTCVSYDEAEMTALSDEIDAIVNSNNSVHECNISYADVVKAACTLKSNKSDGNSGMMSDHIINACDDLFVHNSLLFSSLIVHGAVPDDFSVSTMVPIPKSKTTGITSSSNYLEFNFCQTF